MLSRVCSTYERFGQTGDVSLSTCQSPWSVGQLRSLRLLRSGRCEVHFLLCAQFRLGLVNIWSSAPHIASSLSLSILRTWPSSRSVKGNQLLPVKRSSTSVPVRCFNRYPCLVCFSGCPVMKVSRDAPLGSFRTVCGLKRGVSVNGIGGPVPVCRRRGFQIGVEPRLRRLTGRVYKQSVGSRIVPWMLLITIIFLGRAG
jgi:hypothetical protein